MMRKIESLASRLIRTRRVIIKAVLKDPSKLVGGAIIGAD